MHLEDVASAQVLAENSQVVESTAKDRKDQLGVLTSGFLVQKNLSFLVVLDKDGQVELRIVLSGARRDLGEVGAALTALECKELGEKNPLWSARLRYAYADVLEALDRIDEAEEWFEKAAAVDINQETDARERSLALKKM